MNPVGGTYSGTQSVTVSCDIAGSQIRYTIDGTNPTLSSTLYTTPISISADTTLKAKAYKSGELEPSDIMTEAYVITA